MRFTVWPDPHQSWARVLAVARQAEAAGFHGFRFGDDISDDGNGQPEPGGSPLECWASLSAIAAAVPRLRLVAVVSAQRQRHPAVVTKQAVTADQLSGGRVVLGLWGAADQLLEEACQVVQGLVCGDRTTFHGRNYRLDRAPMEPKPPQQPLPLLTWGDGNQASARLAARFAHQWAVSGSPAQVQAQIEELRRACRDIGRDPAEMTVSASADLHGTSREWVAALQEYARAGVDEWVVPDQSLGDDHQQRLAGLVHLMTEVAPALS